ncbi:ATP-binding protein [Thermosyntropha sp.]|uniref:ATP-binding protein n=1 Tax=Thermosyntropha sp. TaxID=2740820 RepID=UPI0025F69018|nr:ATP-binding protein [Thermosyntropha sp.]MBO8158724.1 response regulator [Thermosyntropha sp.]
MPIIYQDHILENVQESIIAVALNKNNDIVYMNEQAKKIYGNLKKGDLEVLQTKLSLSEEELKEIKKQITSGQKWQGQKWLNTETKKRLLLHKISPLYSSSHLEGFLIVSSDITEFIEKHTEAETANISKSLFLANMSHEIRTPLIGVLGAAELLAKTDLDVRQQEHLSIIRRCGEEVLNIITEILDVAKIEIGLLQLNNKPCNLYNLFENIISIVKPLTAEKGLKLEFNLNFSSCTDALVDQLKLRQVLSHILFNAVKFTHKGKISIHAETKIRDNYKIFLYVAVSDTGIGIPENELKDIFNPFTQVDNSSTRNYGGTGLGLYICHKLIEIMGGNVDIQSSIGHGTTVSFTIPLTPANTRTSITSFEGLKTDNIMETDNQIEFFPPTVLLVEDNNLNQKIVAEILLNYGFEVVTASNGLECLNLLQKEDFDIILMDMQMPLMDGYEATRLIRQDEKWKNIPVIAMTAHAITGDREKCLACGCTSYIAKPFKSEDLISEIKKHLKTPVTDRKKRPVRLNLFMNELMPEFFATLGEMLEELDACIAIKDIEKVQSISHDIKGTAGMYDFNQISETAAQMEQAARRHIWEDIYILQQRLYNLYQDSKANFSEVS